MEPESFRPQRLSAQRGRCALRPTALPSAHHPKPTLITAPLFVLAAILLSTSPLFAAKTLQTKPSKARSEAAQPAASLRDTIQAMSAVIARIDSSLRRSGIFRIGLSVGPRLVVGGLDEVEHGKLRRSPTIDPVTLNLTADAIDRMDIVLSGVVAAYPWRRSVVDSSTRGFLCKHPSWRGLGWVANINLAAFAPENVAVFNKSIEGGVGLAVKLHEDFSLSLTYERVFSRRLRANVKLGEPVVVRGDTLQSISATDDRFFVDDNLTAISFKMIYFLK